MEPRRFQSSINPTEYTQEVNVTHLLPLYPPLPSFPIRAETRQAACLAAIPLLHASRPSLAAPTPFLSPRRFFKLTEPPFIPLPASLQDMEGQARYLAPTLLTSVSSTTGDDDVRGAVSARTLEETRRIRVGNVELDRIRDGELFFPFFFSFEYALFEHRNRWVLRRRIFCFFSSEKKIINKLLWIY